MAACVLAAAAVLLPRDAAAVPVRQFARSSAERASDAIGSNHRETVLARKRSPVAEWATQPAVRRLQDPASCASLLTPAQIADFTALITTNPVVALGVAGATSLAEGVAALKDRGTCYQNRELTHDEWNYFHCLYPNDIDGRSFFYIDGVMVGNGFTLNPGRLPHGMSFSAYQVDEMLTAGHADMTCAVPDLASSCHRGYRRAGVGELTLACSQSSG